MSGESERVRRSILRYLARYEREWGHAVSMPAWHFGGCNPPEEDAESRWNIGLSRARYALGRMTREGLLDRRPSRGSGNLYMLTDAGRQAAP